MKKWTKIAVIGMGMAALVAGLTACTHQTEEERQQRFVKKIVYKLDLNESQSQYAEKLVAEMAELKAEMKQVRQQQLPKLQQLVISEQLQAEQINDLIEAPLKVFENHRTDIIQQMVALHSVLNIEQKKELAEKLQDIEERFADD